MKVHAVILSIILSFLQILKFWNKKKEYKSLTKKLFSRNFILICKYFLEVYFHLNFVP